MLALLPVLILFFVGILLHILGRTRTAIGPLWMIASFSALLVWGLMIALRFQVPMVMELESWVPGGASQDFLRFSLSSSNWILAFSLVSLLLCVIFTDATRLQSTGRLILISGPFVLTGIVLLSVLSASPLSFALTWSVIDFIELAVLMVVTRDEPIYFKTIISFIFRVIGTMLVLAGTVISAQSGAVDFSQVSGMAYILFILGGTLRSGAFPLHLPFSKEDPVRRSMGTILRFAAPISALALLAQLPGDGSLSGWTLIVLLLSIVAAIYGSSMWLTSMDELSGRQYWMLAFIGMALICTLRGQSQAVSILGMIMLTAGGYIFTQTTNLRLLNPLTLLLFANLFGFPFTPGAGIWMNAQSSPWKAANGILLVSLLLLISGLIKFLRKTEKPNQFEEKWVRTFYITGLSIIVISSWIPLIWAGSVFTLYPGWIWSVGLLAAVILGLSGRGYLRTHPLPEASTAGFLMVLLGKMGSYLRRFLSFEWLTRVIWAMQQVFGRFIQFISAILEGEGGVLWALLFLALLASLLSTAG